MSSPFDPSSPLVVAGKLLPKATCRTSLNSSGLFWTVDKKKNKLANGIMLNSRIHIDKIRAVLMFLLFLPTVDGGDRARMIRINEGA